MNPLSSLICHSCIVPIFGSASTAGPQLLKKLRSFQKSVQLNMCNLSTIERLRLSSRKVYK